MRWRVGEYWLSLRDLTTLNIGHRQRRDDPTDVWPPPAATSWDQCLVHPINSICSKASHYGRQNANYLLHVSGGCARTLANNNDWGYRWGYSLFVTFMTFATFATFAKSIKHRPKSIKHSPAASRPANQKPLKNILGRFAADLSKNLSRNLSKTYRAFSGYFGGFSRPGSANVPLWPLGSGELKEKVCNTHAPLRGGPQKKRPRVCHITAFGSSGTVHGQTTFKHQCHSLL